MHKTLNLAHDLSGWKKWYALILLVVVGVYNYIDRISIYILQVEIKEELNLSDTQLGALTGVGFSLVYSTLSIPIARLADRRQRTTIIVISLALWSAMTALCGFASGFIMLLILRMGVAIGEAGSLPASHAMIADYFPLRRRTTALAIWSLCIPLGQMLGFGLSGWLSAAMGWREAFFALGAVGLLMVPLLMFTLKEPPRLDAHGAVSPPGETPPFGEAVRILWRSRALRHIIWGGSLNAFVLYTFLNWNAPFYNRVHGFSMAELAGYLALLSGLGAGLGMILGGVAAERLGLRDERWRMRVPLIGALGAVPLIILQYFVPDARLSLVIGVFSYALSSAYYPSMIACIQSLAPANLRALAAASQVLAVNLLGMGLGPLFVGMVSDYLIAHHGMVTDSLRYAIAGSSVFGLWAAYHFHIASRHLPHELKRTG